MHCAGLRAGGGTASRSNLERRTPNARSFWGQIKLRRARFRMRWDAAKVQRSQSEHRATVLDSAPISNAEIITSSPRWCVKPPPGSSRSLMGANGVPAKQRQPVRVGVVFVQCLSGQILQVAADFRHVALLRERESIGTVNQQVYGHVSGGIDVEVRVEQSNEGSYGARSVVVLRMAEQQRGIGLRNPAN